MNNFYSVVFFFFITTMPKNILHTYLIKNIIFCKRKPTCFKIIWKFYCFFQCLYWLCCLKLSTTILTILLTMGLNQFHGYGFSFQIIIQTIFAQFTSHAGLLIAAEGSLWQNSIITINPYRAGIYIVGKEHGLVNIIGYDTSGQAVFHIVGTFNNFVDGAEFENGLNGAKDRS